MVKNDLISRAAAINAVNAYDYGGMALDHLNIALGHLLKKPEENRFAIEEICYAIAKAGGYFYDSVAEELELIGMGSFLSKS